MKKASSVFIFSTSMIFASTTGALTFESLEKGAWAYIDNPNVYDYAPTAMQDYSSGDWQVWHCGYGSATNGDVIQYTRIGINGYVWNTSTVLSPDGAIAAEDARHTCAPTVFKHSNQYMFQGAEVYKIYYECARKFYDISAGTMTEGFTQICHAISYDGINWLKYNEGLWNSSQQFGGTPTPVVEANSTILTNTSYQFSNGTHKIDSTAMVDGKNYGVGHPSAVVRSNGEIWMWYYDSTGTWADRGVYLVKSWDGFHFGPAIKTQTVNNSSIPVQNPMDIRYLSGLGKFVGQMVINGNNVFAYSDDGITWTWADPYNTGRAAVGGLLYIGQAVGDHCGSAGQSTIVANKYGDVNTSDPVYIISQEGHYGPDDQKWPHPTACDIPSEPMRGSTWALHVHKGRFLP